MVPHEFKMLWELSMEPQTAGELAATLNARDGYRRYIEPRTPRGVQNQLRRLVRVGLLARDRDGAPIYRVTDLGRLYLKI